MATGELTINGRRLELVTGDITEQQVDVIANAANSALRGGGGVDGAIHHAAGPGLMDELRESYPTGTQTGTAVATGAHRLKARWVLHAVGPIWRGGAHGEEELLRGAYRSCLQLCDQLGAQSAAFPAISMGIYGYPPDEAARVALSTVADHLRGDTSLDLVRFVLFSDSSRAVFDRALSELAAPA